MKTKNIIIFSIISSFFLVSLISIWKILVTLQGIKLENFNFQIIFLLGFLVSLAHVITVAYTHLTLPTICSV